MMMLTPNRTGVATSTVDRRIVADRPPIALSSLPRWLNAFSTTTTEPSTISPIAIARPPRDIRLAESPTRFITMNVASGVSTRVATTMSDERTSPRNRKSTITTRMMPSISTFTTVPSAASTSSERS